MTIVMPLSYGDKDVIRRGWGSWQDKELALRNPSKFRHVRAISLLGHRVSVYRKRLCSRSATNVAKFAGSTFAAQFVWIYELSKIGECQ